MIIILFLNIILSNALTMDRTISIINSKIVIKGLIFTAFILCYNLYAKTTVGELCLYEGLLNINIFTQSFKIFTFILMIFYTILFFQINISLRKHSFLHNVLFNILSHPLHVGGYVLFNRISIYIYYIIKWAHRLSNLHINYKIIFCTFYRDYTKVSIRFLRCYLVVFVYVIYMSNTLLFTCFILFTLSVLGLIYLLIIDDKKFGVYRYLCIFILMATILITGLILSISLMMYVLNFILEMNNNNRSTNNRNTNPSNNSSGEGPSNNPSGGGPNNNRPGERHAVPETKRERDNRLKRELRLRHKHDWKWKRQQCEAAEKAKQTLNDNRLQAELGSNEYLVGDTTTVSQNRPWTGKVFTSDNYADTSQITGSSNPGTGHLTAAPELQPSNSSYPTADSTVGGVQNPLSNLNSNSNSSSNYNSNSNSN